MATMWRSATRCAGSRTSCRNGRIWSGRRPRFSLSAFVTASAVAASEFGRHAIRERLEVRQFPAQHAEARRLHLGRRLRVVPEIPEGAWIRSGSAESASGPFEQRVGLVESSRGGEAWEAERLRVPRVRGDERLDGGPCVLVAELAVDDLQDFIEAAARELDERPHARSGRTAHPPAGRVEGLPAIGG